MPADTRPPAIALMGPTAAGKTALGLAWAQRFDGEIVSVDSALVYRHLQIGAAKPTPEERARVPHHLLDVRDPWQTYSAAEFAVEARDAVDDVVRRGKVPILVGGTGLYFQALLRGLAPMPAADPEVRARLQAEAGQRGWPALHAELAAVDPDAGRSIRPSDPQRIQRALEVFRLSGRPISAWQRDVGERPRFPCRVVKLVIAPVRRQLLHERIERRFDAMLEAGFLDEMRALRAMPPLREHPAPLDLPAMRAVGYRQAWEHLEGHSSEDEFRERGIYATRQLAKRQLTWLRGQHDALWFDPEQGPDRLLQTVESFLGTPALARARRGWVLADRGYV